MFGSISTRDAGLYIAAQVIGGCLGAMLANLMFELPAIELSTKGRSSAALWLSEILATVGLLLVIHGCVRTGRANVVAFAVGIWIGGAYWFTSSTSFANPAVTIARTLSDTFTGHRAVVGADVHPHAARRRRNRLRADPPALSGSRPRRAMRPRKGRPCRPSTTCALAQQHLIRTAASRLQDEFGGIFGPETIERYINDSLDQLLPNSEIVSFVPIFVERFAKDRLKALAKVEGKMTATSPA